jgi:hypothetical protein
MTLLSLTYAEFERLLKVFAAVTALVACSIFLVRWQLFAASAWSAASQGFAGALSATAIGFGFFAKRTWDSPRLAKWLGRPVVHGVWLGNLGTNYESPKGNTLPPIQIVFVIKQTYLSLSIESFTSSQEGESSVEALIRNAKTDVTRLCYMFELRRRYKGENKLTAGSGELRLLEGGNRLRGHYWTNSHTQGHVDLRLVSRDCRGVDCFEATEGMWLKQNT